MRLQGQVTFGMATVGEDAGDRVWTEVTRGRSQQGEDLRHGGGLRQGAWRVGERCGIGQLQSDTNAIWGG